MTATVHSDSPAVSLTRFAHRDCNAKCVRLLRGADTEAPTGLWVLSGTHSTGDLIVNQSAGTESSLLAYSDKIVYLGVTRFDGSLRGI